MKIDYIKIDQLDPTSAYWVWIDGKQEGTATASDAQKTADKINIQEMAAEERP